MSRNRQPLTDPIRTPTFRSGRIAAVFPSSQTASMERSAEPIMKSSWIMESFTPSLRHSSSVLFWKSLMVSAKPHAERQMAAGVLVEQCVVEQQARLVDGRIERHERAFAQIPAALVHFDELRQKLVVFLGVPFDGLASWKRIQKPLISWP